MTDAGEVAWNRSAGILLHITSLPGPAYVGDLGPAAAEFVDFLHGAGQAFWQLLPVQPTVHEQGYSPYSSSSAFAGNPLLISPELLVRDGILNNSDLKTVAAARRVDYKKAEDYKNALLRKAWGAWKNKATATEKLALTEYSAAEQDWLNDYALYNLLKVLNKGQAWYEWPSEMKDRHSKTLENLASKYADELEFTRWVQMIFDRQWRSLHELSRSMGIKLLGDVPIYVAHDSADVWSHRDLFTLDDQGKLTEVAGVPPDLFNDEGQLWGMPLYKWDLLKETGYAWWIARLRKNIRWFDWVRLDHFRGFSSYWSVPADEKTAKHGKWIKGPAEDLFETLKKELGSLPFVAEDLGEIDKPVYQLRDRFALPGMNVLQFAFGDDIPKSPYLPHNHVVNSLVYTGTHDNNTTVGWYKDSDKTIKHNLAEYLGGKITDKNVADVLMRMAYGSVAKLAIIPMQDVLSMNADARMNMPASTKGNWTWRLQEKMLSPQVTEKLKKLAFVYGRVRSE